MQMDNGKKNGGGSPENWSGNNETSTKTPKHYLTLPLLAYMKQKPRLQSLPRTFTSSSGLKAMVDYLKEEDIPEVYGMFRKAASKEEGYSKDEFDTLETFQDIIIDHGHPLVVTDLQTSKIFAALTIVPNVMSRSVDPCLADCYMVIAEDYRNKGLGIHILSIVTQLQRELGYTGSLSDTVSENVAMNRLVEKLGYSYVGCIPKAAEGTNGEMIHMIIMFLSLKNEGNLESKL